MLVVTFTVLGDTVLARGLSRFGDDCKDFMPVWPEIAQDFVRIEEEQFATQGARGGATWAPLSPSYQAWKDRAFPGKLILELTGALKFAMTAGLYVDMRPLRLWMAPMLDLAFWHQQGTGKMPARKVVALTEADKMGWVKTIQRYLVEKATEEGLR